MKFRAQISFIIAASFLVIALVAYAFSHKQDTQHGQQMPAAQKQT